MKTIVALVDFSDVTAKVIEQARDFAAASGARVILLHAVPQEVVAVDLGIASPTLLHAPTAKRIEADCERLLDLRDTLAKGGVNVTAQQLDDASVEKVLAHCKGVNADIIVVGAHHHSAIYNWFIGTFTNEVLKQARCPVLVVPAERDEPAPSV